MSQVLVVGDDTQKRCGSIEAIQYLLAVERITGCSIGDMLPPKKMKRKTTEHDMVMIRKADEKRKRKAERRLSNKP